MSNGDWEDLREEVCTYLELGANQGETELDTMTRLVWLERQKHVDLCAALETALRASTPSLERERGIAAKQAVILQWRKPKPKSASVAVTNGEPGAEPGGDRRSNP
jgi:hypothetical protein